MTYKELLRIIKNNNANTTKTEVEKILSPAPAAKIEEIEKIIPYSFIYTGPEEWTKIIKDFESKKH